jgi:hypothetical protein
VKIGDLGSDLWAWALGFLGVTAATVRKISVLSFAIGLDVVIWSLIWFATAAFSTRATQLTTAANVNASNEKLVGSDVAEVALMNLGDGTGKADNGQSDFDANGEEVDPRWFADVPQGPKPGKRKPASKKKAEHVVEKLAAQMQAGKKPSLKLVVSRHDLPKTTAWRRLKAAEKRYLQAGVLTAAN